MQQHVLAAWRCLLLRQLFMVLYMLSSCVCLSVTSQHCTKTAKRRITQTVPYDIAETSLLMTKLSAKFQQGHPLRVRQIQVGYVQIGDFRPTSRYISETVQDRDIVNMEH